MDRWICSRLYSTVLQCEQAFEAYELHTVTSALYSFWVHNLCDVYVVRSITLNKDRLKIRQCLVIYLLLSLKGRRIYL